MATYVMSDLHGAFNALQEMLQLIQFSEEDTLYIIGDVVDRGPSGVEILQFVMRTPNIKMLLGNHEHMCMQFFSEKASQTVIRRWNRNGNFPTLAGFDRVTAEEKQEILEFIRNLPSEAVVAVNGIDFVLVHGFPDSTPEDRVWNRPTIDEIPRIPGSSKLIIGHTPVCEYVCPGSDEDMYVYSRKLTENGDHFRIFHAEGFTDVDCCVGYGLSAARAACLRLDDGKEFYVQLKGDEK